MLLVCASDFVNKIYLTLLEVVGYCNLQRSYEFMFCIALIVPATPCCVSSSTIVNLRNGTVTDGGVGEVINKPEGTPSSATPCNLRALIKVRIHDIVQ